MMMVMMTTTTKWSLTGYKTTPYNCTFEGNLRILSNSYSKELSSHPLWSLRPCAPLVKL